MDSLNKETEVLRASDNAGNSGSLRKSRSSKALGRAIQEARQNAGLTQQELCEHADISYSTLAKIERGAIKTPSVFTVHTITQVLGTSMDDLMGAVVDTPRHSVSHSKVVKKTSKSGVSFIYFDVNGCLVQFFNAAFSRLAQETHVSSDVIESAFWHYNDAVCRGEMTVAEFNDKLAARIGVPSIDWQARYLETIEPIKAMHELVSWASGHYRVGLLTNIMPGFVNTMIDQGYLPNIAYDAIVDSSVVSANKPEPEIYQAAEGAANVPPEQILFVDDSRTNLMAAEHRGWKVMWFDNYQPETCADTLRKNLEF